MTNIDTHVGITLGPIYETFRLARKTREFWAVSFMFSMLAEKLCLELMKNGVKKDDFLVPHHSIIGEQIKNVGLYLDRIVLKGNHNLWEKIPEIIAAALEELTKKLNNIDNVDLRQGELQDYFRIYAVFKSGTTNPLENISEALNGLELMNTGGSKDNVEAKIRKFIENVNTEYSNSSDFEENNFLKNYYDIEDFNGNKRIASIQEISTVELSEQTPYRETLNETLWRRKDDEDFYKTLKENRIESVRNYHKYYCIVQADGNDLGKTLIKSDASQISDLSKELIQWGKSALKIIKSYGGVPIYIGGDDLLCFCPVSNKKTVLDFVNDLNRAYAEKETLSKYSSLRFGVAISYHKSPMYESYMQTFDLMREARQLGNACAIGLEKHSGQPQKWIFGLKKSDTFESYIEPIIASMTREKEKMRFLTSVLYKINSNQELIYHASFEESRLWSFFQNTFEEAGDGKEAVPDYKYLKAVCNYLFYLFSEHKDTKVPGENQYTAIREVYSALKTIRFIKGMDDDKN